MSLQQEVATDSLLLLWRGLNRVLRWFPASSKSSSWQRVINSPIWMCPFRACCGHFVAAFDFICCVTNWCSGIMLVAGVYSCCCFHVGWLSSFLRTYGHFHCIFVCCSCHVCSVCAQFLVPAANFCCFTCFLCAWCMSLVVLLLSSRLSLWSFYCSLCHFFCLCHVALKSFCTLML